jgi:hypothetical protein
LLQKFGPRTHLKTKALAMLVMAFVCPTTLRAQQDDEVIRTNTELVVLNVTVTDKAGQYVPGLRLSDFAIFEDGKQIPFEVI